MIATPRPPSTRGSSGAFAYTRRPGLETRRMPARLRSRVGPYFSSTTRVLPTVSSTGSSTVQAATYPSALRTSAMFALIFEYGIETRSWYAWLALRRRVSMSAIGSVMVMCLFDLSCRGSRSTGLRQTNQLPGSLCHAGQFATVRHVTDADTAQAELAVHRLRTPAALATGVRAHRELRLRGGLELERLLGHFFLSSP